MIIDVNAVLKTRTGEPLEQATKVVEGKVLEVEPITFKIAVVNALEAMTEADKDLSGMEKRKRGQLADKVYAGDDTTELTLEECQMIKDRVGIVCSTYVVNRIYDIIGE